MTQLRYPIQSYEYNLNGLRIMYNMLLLLRIEHVLQVEIELRILLCTSLLIHMYIPSALSLPYRVYNEVS